MTMPTNNVRWMGWILVVIMALTTREAQGHGNTMATGGPGRMAVDPMIGQVDAGSGAVTDSIVDFAMPSRGSSAVQWRHHRTYHSHWTGGDSDTVQGQRWFHHYLQNLTLEAGGEDTDDKDVTWRSDAHHTYVFANAGTYSFTSPDNTFATLTHLATSTTARDWNNTYCLTFLDGTKMFFYDFESGGTPQGKLKYIEDVYGQRLNVYYDGSNRVDYITDPSGHYFRYAYLSSGANSGKLDTVKVYVSSGTSTADQIAQIDFTYRDSTTPDSLDAGCGLTGDLVKALVKTHKTGETSSTFSINSSNHYRYWSGTYNTSTNAGHDHELRFIIRPEHFDRATTALGNPLTATTAQIDDYGSFAFEYDNTANRCRKETFGIGSSGGGCGSCGGGGGGDTGDFTLTYTTQSSSTRNDWAIRTKVEHNDWTRYYLCNNWGELYIEVLFSVDASDELPLWVHKYERESDFGRVTTEYTPASITFYNTSTHALTYNNNGRVVDYGYDSSSKQLQSRRVRKYSEAGSAAVYEGYWVYASASLTGYRTRYLLTESYVFPSAVTSSPTTNGLKTAFAYVFRADAGDRDGDTNTSEATDEPLVVKVSMPSVSTTQNGPNVGADRFSWFNSFGQAQWTKDEEGAVHYQAFHDKTGATSYSVRDVYTGTVEANILPAGITSPETDGGNDIWTDWTGAAPKDVGATPAYDFQTTGTSSNYVKLENKSLFDLQGRLRRSTDPAGAITFMAHLDKEFRSYAGWNSSTDKPFLPVRRSLTDREGRSVEAIEVNGSSVTFSDPPDGSEALTTRATWVSWSKTSYDSSLRPDTKTAYVTIPSSGSGTLGSDYFETKHSYADVGNGQTYVQIRDPQGGYTRTTFDAQGRTISVQGTATESSGNPTNLKLLKNFAYDQATPGTGGSLGGNGNVTQVDSYYSDSNSNTTTYSYDWRDRRVLTTPPLAPFTLSKFDNQGREVAVGQYSSAPSASADPTSNSTNRLALSETLFNDRGQVYRTKRWEINASTGATDAVLTTDTYYDRIGRVVAVDPPNTGVTVTQYDGAGRVVATQTCASLGSTIYDATTKQFDYTSDNKVIELVSHAFDVTGRPATETTRYEINAGSNTYVDPASPTSNSMPSKSRSYFDTVGRQTQITNFGSYPSGASDAAILLQPANAAHQTLSAYSSGSPETASSTKLVTKWTFGADGRLSKVTDPSGMESDYEHDALGRQTAVIEDSGTGGKARRTEYQYNGNSDLTKLLAKSVADYGYGAAGPDDQITQYVYGHAVNSRWVAEIRYPGSDGQPSSSSGDKVVLTYNHDGTVATRTDQNGSVLTNDYDALRRATQERVTTLGSGVDGSVRRLATTYDSLGRAQLRTSYDNATVGSGSVVNEVKLTYNGLSQLTKDEQDHDGAVISGTPAVSYTYTEDTTNNHSRLYWWTVPNGKELNLDYSHSAGSGTRQSEIAAALSRPARVYNKTSNKYYVEYTYAGLSRMIKRDCPLDTNIIGNDTKVDLDKGTANEYSGLDLFGRVLTQSVSASSSGSQIKTEIQYASNIDGSPKFAEEQNETLLGKSAAFAYDSLHRLTGAKFGRLDSADRTNPVSEWTTPREHAYTMDILGNFTAIDRKNNGTSASEARTHNATNEIVDRIVPAEAVRRWVNDDFADNDTATWAIADIVSGGGDGTWSAASGKLQNDTVVTITGAPGSGTASIMLADVGKVQDIRLYVDVTLSASADNGGLVFGYVDAYNFWLLLTRRGLAWELFEVTGSSGAGRTFTSRGTSVATSSSGGSTAGVWAYVKSNCVQAWPVHGSAGDKYAASIPAGRVGVWAGSGSAGVKFDNFSITEHGCGPFEIDGRWFGNTGTASVALGKLSFTGASSDDGRNFFQTAVRRGYRGGGSQIVQWSHPVTDWHYGGAVLHYQDPENYMLASLNYGTSTAFPVLYKMVKGEPTLVASASAISVANGDTIKCVITESGGAQTLKMYVAGTLRLTTTTIDDTWSGGMVGMCQWTGSGSMAFDDFKVGYDSNADNDIDDAGDDIQIDDNFNDPGGGVTWQKITLSHDANGNLTDDGILLFKYDAWNRMVGATRRLDALTTVAAYAYDGLNRRVIKVVSNCGIETTPDDGGNTIVHFYYDQQWRIIETRNDKNETTRQFVYGLQYIDEPVLIDISGNPAIGNDCDPDNTASGEGSESPADHRYFYHQDRNWNVTTLTDYEPNGGGNTGAIVERYSYTPYGDFVAYGGVSGGSEMARPRHASSVGALFAHQGLLFDTEVVKYQNRHREYLAGLGRFGQRDPLKYQDGMNLTASYHQRPTVERDSLGLISHLCASKFAIYFTQCGSMGQSTTPHVKEPQLPPGTTVWWDCVSGCVGYYGYGSLMTCLSMCNPQPWQPRAPIPSGSPRSDSQCCLDYIASGWPSPFIAGVTLCCDGRKVSCANGQPTGDFEADIIKATCIRVHEDTHHDDVNCAANEGWGTPTRPNWTDPSQADYQECVGYCAEIQCLYSNMGNCSTDVCRTAIWDRIWFLKGEAQTKCAGYVPPGGC